jgi:uncharacterized repeat protein (TIGR03837 family)
VEVVHWTAQVPPHAPGDVVVEAFGCDPPDEFVARMRAAPRPPAWINLEYLSAESYVERSHGLPSPVGSGPGAGLVKHFFYPGFTAKTGGLLREQDVAQRRAHFDRADWLHPLGLRPAARVVSLFCYEPPALPELLRHLALEPTELLVTAGRPTAAMHAALARLAAEHAGWNAQGLLRPHRLPLLSQRDYDHLLWSCDLNFVRGEDSLVRGLLAGVPCIWHIYPQDDLAHHAKLEAFLRWLQPPDSQARFHRVWNGLEPAGLPAPDLAAWRGPAAETLTKIQALPELATELERFVAGRGRI